MGIELDSNRIRIGRKYSLISIMSIPSADEAILNYGLSDSERRVLVWEVLEGRRLLGWLYIDNQINENR
jgi:hypothetical protein